MKKWFGIIGVLISLLFISSVPITKIDDIGNKQDEVVIYSCDADWLPVEVSGNFNTYRPLYTDVYDVGAYSFVSLLKLAIASININSQFVDSKLYTLQSSCTIYKNISKEFINYNTSEMLETRRAQHHTGKYLNETYNNYKLSTDSKYSNSLAFMPNVKRKHHTGKLA